MMKTIRQFLLLALSATVLFAGCGDDYDDSDLWNEVNKQAQRIAALEQWQTTVNGQIGSLQGLVSALENNDYVTGVTPVTEDGETIGYTISFTKSAPITIYHGTDGDDGDDGDDGSTPVIGVSLHTDGLHYWTLDGEWLLDSDGKMIRASGLDGAPGAAGTTPQVKIDTNPDSATNNEWLISTDGGATWEPTGVPATGPRGPRGLQGDAFFADAPQDKTSYWEFKLAGGGTIELPKYKSVGIDFDQTPDVFLAGTAKEIEFTSTGTVDPTNIRIVDLPKGWKYEVDYLSDPMKITITPPGRITTDNAEGEATVLVGIDNQVAAMYPLTVSSTGATANTVGSLYYVNSEVVGIVYIERTTPGSGRVVSLYEAANLAWGLKEKVIDDVSSLTDGRANTGAMASFISNNAGQSSPAFSWVDNLNGSSGPSIYTSTATGVWYLPARSELQTLFTLARSSANLNTAITNNSGDAITTAPSSLYWSSSSEGSWVAFWVNANDNSFEAYDRNDSYRVRAILAF